MPHLSWSRTALFDLERLYSFLRQKNDVAARSAIRAIRRHAAVLKEHPRIGHNIDGLGEEFREIVIPFGQYAYILRYRLHEAGVLITNVRHSREAGY